MNNVVFGKYLPYDTIIHRIDPRSKIIVLFLMLVSVFIPNNWLSFVPIALVCVICLILARISFKTIIKTFKPMLFMMIFLLVVNCLSIKTGKLLLEIGSFKIYYDAVNNTLLTVVRLLLMIIITTILTATTKPLDLTLGIEYLLKPTKKLGFPAHEMAMAISIALRFIPDIIEETMRIMNAQKSRGVDFEEGKIKEKINAILSLIVPLFSVAFQRAGELADAMEARGYVPGQERTRYKQLHFTVVDAIYTLIGFLILGFVIYLKVVL